MSFLKSALSSAEGSENSPKISPSSKLSVLGAIEKLIQQRIHQQNFIESFKKIRGREQKIWANILWKENSLT